MTRILLFIPFFNCERQISRVLEKVRSCSGSFDEILLVDNRSTDNSVETARLQLQQLGLTNVTVIRNKENYNLGGSHKVAFQYAIQNGHTHLVVLHGDDQADIREVVPLILKMEHLNYDCLLGARFHPHSSLIGYSRFRTLGNIVLNQLCGVVCRKTIMDMGSGLNVYSVDFLKDKRIHLFPNDLTFNVFLLFHSCFIQTRLIFFPLTWREEDQISNAKVFKQFRTIMKLILNCLKNKDSIYLNHVPQDLKYDLIYKA